MGSLAPRHVHSDVGQTACLLRRPPPAMAARRPRVGGLSTGEGAWRLCPAALTLKAPAVLVATAPHTTQTCVPLHPPPESES